MADPTGRNSRRSTTSSSRKPGRLKSTRKASDQRRSLSAFSGPDLC
jgi:hypothetical protein